MAAGKSTQSTHINDLKAPDGKGQGDNVPWRKRTSHYTTHHMARILTNEEPPKSLHSCRSSLLNHLGRDERLHPFLNRECTWTMKGARDPTRGLKSDTVTVGGATWQSATQKAILLEYVLDQIATQCPIIWRNTITKRATSLHEIWTIVWQHYNLQPSSFDKTNRGKQPNRTYNFSTHTVQNSSTVTHKTGNLHNKPPFTINNTETAFGYTTHNTEATPSHTTHKTETFHHTAHNTEATPSHTTHKTETFLHTAHNTEATPSHTTHKTETFHHTTHNTEATPSHTTHKTETFHHTAHNTETTPSHTTRKTETFYHTAHNTEATPSHTTHKAETFHHTTHNTETTPSQTTHKTETFHQTAHNTTTQAAGNTLNSTAVLSPTDTPPPFFFFFFLLFIVFIQEIHIHKSTNTSQFKLCSLICLQ